MERIDSYVEELARQAGEYARTQASTMTVSSKNNDPRDLVTNIDIAISDQLKEKISQSFPADKFYSEEDPSVVHSEERTWAIDPIDGTSNYARSLPLYSSCVSVLQNSAVLASAIYAPVLNECFVYRAGEALLNGVAIQVRGTTKLYDAYVNFHPGRKEEYRQWAADTKKELLGKAKKSINYGSSALDLCYLAAGRIDVLVYGTLNVVDVAGAVAMVRAAGGEVYNFDTKEPVSFTTESQRIIATTTPELLADYMDLIEKV